MKIILLLFIFCTALSCKQETQKTISEDVETVQEIEGLKDLQPEVAAIAAAHGLENWDKVEQISFTFNVDRQGKNVAQRSWSWKPKTNDVTMITATDTITYNRNKLESESLKADQGFINDKYWLLAPYQIAWDEGTTVEIVTHMKAPLSQRPMKKLTLTYGSEGGYTPGDAYDFYYEIPGKIEEWVFRRGNAEEPSMVTTFQDYKQIEGLRIATDHRDKDGSFRLYFTDISIETTD